MTSKVNSSSLSSCLLQKGEGGDDRDRGNKGSCGRLEGTGLSQVSREARGCMAVHRGGEVGSVLSGGFGSLGTSGRADVGNRMAFSATLGDLGTTVNEWGLQSV